MKKILALLLCLVTACTCITVTGCGNGSTGGLTEEQKQNALIIEYYKAGYGEVWIENLAAAYKNKTGREVVLLARSGEEGVSNMVTSLKSETADTDLFITKNPSFDDLYIGGAKVQGKTYDTWYADLSDVYNATIEGEGVTVKEKMFDAFENYYKMPNDGSYYSDKYYFFPWVTAMLGIVVNMDVWNKVMPAGSEFPRTTDELLEICESVKSKVAPLIYSLGDEYFTSIYQVFMAQYEGKEAMDKFYAGYAPSGERYDTNMVAYDGFKKSLEFFEAWLKPENGYTHKDSKSLTFMQMQGQFMNEAALFNINGDWLEREMINKYPNANIAMMKTPVLSSIADKCSFKDAQNRDAILRAAIDFVDGKQGATQPAECTDADIAYIREARSIEYVAGNDSVALIPCYSNQTQAAKDFLLFMASDEGMNIFSKGTNGCELPFNYTNPIANTDVTTFRQSINKVLAVSEKRFVNNKDKIFSSGGVSVFLNNNSIGRFVKAFTSETDRKTALEYYNAEIRAVNALL